MYKSIEKYEEHYNKVEELIQNLKYKLSRNNIMYYSESDIKDVLNDLSTIISETQKAMIPLKEMLKSEADKHARND